MRYDFHKNQFEGWVPEFGNGHHKFIIQVMEEYYALREKYERSIASKRPDPELKKRCVFEKQRIRKMLKDDKKERFLRNASMNPRP